MRLQPAALAHAVERGEEMMVGTPPIIDLSKLEGTARIAADALKQLQETQEHAIAAVAQAGAFRRDARTAGPAAGAVARAAAALWRMGPAGGHRPTLCAAATRIESLYHRLEV